MILPYTGRITAKSQADVEGCGPRRTPSGGAIAACAQPDGQTLPCADRTLTRPLWTLPSGPVLINSSDPATSNSGMTLAQLELATVASGNPYQPASEAQAGAALAKVKALVDAQGLMRTGSDSAFEQWVIQQTGGLLAGYENQLLQWITTRNGGVVPPGIVTLYPEPTIFNDHPILTLPKPVRN